MAFGKILQQNIKKYSTLTPQKNYINFTSSNKKV